MELKTINISLRKTKAKCIIVFHEKLGISDYNFTKQQVS